MNKHFIQYFTLLITAAFMHTEFAHADAGLGYAMDKYREKYEKVSAFCKIDGHQLINRGNSISLLDQYYTQSKEIQRPYRQVGDPYYPNYEYTYHDRGTPSPKYFDSMALFATVDSKNICSLDIVRNHMGKEVPDTLVWTVNKFSSIKNQPGSVQNLHETKIEVLPNSTNLGEFYHQYMDSVSKMKSIFKKSDESQKEKYICGYHCVQIYED